MYIIVVSGLPRSGTSMAMRMLGAGGLPIYADSTREADTSNPHGYFESREVMDIMHKCDFIAEAKGKAIKVVSPLLRYLPRANMSYRLVFMRRDLEEIIASQRRMLSLGKKPTSAPFDEQAMIAQYRKHLKQIETWLENDGAFDTLYVRHADVLKNPQRLSEQITSFLQTKLNTEKMAAAVDRALYRNKA